MEVKVEVLSAAAAHDIAMEKYEILKVKEVQKVMKYIKAAAKRGKFELQLINLYADTSDYLKKMGYEIREFYDMDNDRVFRISWNK
jgi:hypothetical protein